MAGKIAKRPKEDLKGKAKRGTIKVPQYSSISSEEQAELSAAGSLEFWQSEVAALQGERYASLDQAIEAVVNRVVVRLLGDAKGEDELTSFLTDIIESDPDLQEELKRSLNIDVG